MAKYDPQIIQQFADGLYAQAASATVGSTAIGCIVAAFLGYAGASPDMRVAFAIAGAIIGALLGYLVGAKYAASLRLRAQMALCQMQIEANTRR